MVPTSTDRIETKPLLLSLPEAAALLQVSIPSLRRWIRLGRLGSVRCGRAVRIEAREVERFIARNRRDPRAD